MFSKVLCGNICGISAQIVSVEVDVQSGLPGFDMGGTLSTEVREAKERVRVALKNSRFAMRPQHITVNISPANTPKSGTGFDLALAAAWLCAGGLVDDRLLADTLVMGELGLDGKLRPVKGVLPCIIKASKEGIARCIVPEGNAFEGACAEGITVYKAATLKDTADFLNGREDALEQVQHVDHKRFFCSFKNQDSLEENKCRSNKASSQVRSADSEEEPDFADVTGQEAAVRASMIAAAGGHNIIYMGAPGSGKTMMAKRIAGVLPDLSIEESLEVSEIYSIAGLLDNREGGAGLITRPPYRSPHHTITAKALIGGGRIPGPGEITLAHKGMLFLDELTEFRTATLDAMRQPLEERSVTLARCGNTYVFPADFMLAAAMNPCKCGYFPDMSRCTCTENEIKRYRARISRPLMDRFDLCVQVSPVDGAELIRAGEKGTKSRCISSLYIRGKVAEARNIQKARGKLNSELTKGDIRMYCRIGSAEKMLMEKVMKKLLISARGYYKILKVARTIADIEGRQDITCEHIGEAVAYRS